MFTPPSPPFRCLGEFGATITFAANVPGETRTLPLALYTALQIPGGEAAATRLALISVALAIIALVASQYLAKQVSKRIGLS
jgi:molybdate transport system permease protein